MQDAAGASVMRLSDATNGTYGFLGQGSALVAGSATDVVLRGETGNNLILSIAATPQVTINATGATFAGTLSAGATTVTSLASSGHITVGAALGMRSSETDQLVYVSGGPGINDGANMLLYGQSHATQAYDITFRGNVGVVLQYDESAATWDFQAKAITTTGTLSAGAATLSGVTTSSSIGIQRSIDTDVTVVSGGSSTGNGFNITAYGGSHATAANDARFRAGGSVELYYDDSASEWDFQANAITTTGTGSFGATTVSSLTNIGVSNLSDTLTLTNAQPKIDFIESGVTADNGNWRVTAEGEAFYLQAMNDAKNSFGTVMQVDRTGTTIDSIAFTATNATFAGAVSMGPGDWPTTTIGQSAGRAAVLNDTQGILVVADMGATAGATKAGAIVLGGRNTTGTPNLAYAQIKGAKASGSGTWGSTLALSTQTTGATIVDALTIDQNQNATFAGTADITNGVYIGGSAAANLLDDYEEGTFTPAVAGSGTAGSASYTVQVGQYTKIGNHVNFTLRVDWSGHTGSGNFLINGLPFSSQNTSNIYGGGSIVGMANITNTSAHYLSFQISPNATQGTVIEIPTAGGGDSALTLDTAGTLVITGSYYV
jgi:hypothetical protein